jgi:nitrite reductase (NADH) large subunit
MRCVAAVIIGNGVAGVTAARYLSEAGAEVEVYTQEAHHYYPRPRLQKFLAGEIGLDELPLYSLAWYEKRGIAVHLATEVVELDPRAKRIVLAACTEASAEARGRSNGRQVSYDRLLLATGSRPFVPPIQGVDKAASSYVRSGGVSCKRSGVFTLRTIEDALAIKRWAEGAKRAIVVGCGLLGLEAARALTGLGLGVTVLERGAYPLRRQLDAQGGALMRELIQAMGIKVACNASSQAILGDGQATGVLLQDGRRIEGDLILISAGIRCNVGLAQEAGLEVNRGVVVDEHLRTSADDIYAAGDVAEFRGQVYGIIPACLEQAKVAALNMLGEEVAYEDTIPFNTLQVVGIDCTSIGMVHPPEGGGYQELRKSEARVYKKLVLKDGRLVGAILLGDKKDAALIGRFIRAETDVSRHVESLLDDDFDWKKLL